MAQARVENAANMERMRQESANNVGPLEEDIISPDPIWQALARCEITLTMEKLLQIVPWLRQAVEERIMGRLAISVSANFTETRDSPKVVDHHNRAIKLVLHGQEVAGCIIDGGSGVNVISAKTCEQLGISEWEACPFCLLMADTRSVRPLGLTLKLGIIIGGHRFDILVVVLALEDPGGYPMLLGRSWLELANIKQNWKYNYISFL